MKELDTDRLIALRGVAAVMIVIYHQVGMPPLQLPAWTWWLVTFCGLGVPIFYVLSAFSLFFSYFDRMKTVADLKAYFIKRYFRIAPLFYVMIGVYFVYLEWEYAVAVTTGDVLASLTFTFNLIPSKVTGFVWASWSIGVEFVFYAIVPLLLLTIRSFAAAATLAVSAAVLLVTWKTGSVYRWPEPSFFPFRSYFIASHFFTFSCGILSFFVFRQLPAGNNRPFIAITICGFALLAFAIGSRYSVGVMAESSAYFLLHASAIGLVVTGMALKGALCPAPRWLTSLGKRSFSLYLVHPLVIGFYMRRDVYSGIYEQDISQTTALSICLLVTFATVMPVAELCYRLIETPGVHTGSWLIRRLRQKNASAQRKVVTA